MDLMITDADYLANGQRLALIQWAGKYKRKLLFAAIVAIYCVIQVTGLRGQDAGPGLVFRMCMYFLLFLAVVFIGYAFYKREVVLKKLAVMKQYEIQVKKVPMQYSLNDTRIRMDYGHSFKEYPWVMFHRFQFHKGFLILSNPYRLIDMVWMRVPPENEAEIGNFVAALQVKYQIQVIR